MTAPNYIPVRRGDFSKVREAMTLTDEQSAAALSTDDFVHVQAPPGSGKTRVLVARLSYLIEAGIDPATICCVTFTRSAAAEIKDRVETVVGPVAEGITVATFHELALKLCPLPDGFSVATDAENEAAIRSLYEGPMRRRDVPSITKVKAATRKVDAAAYMRPLELTAPQMRAAWLVRQRLRTSKTEPIWAALAVLRDWLDENEHPFEHALVDETQDVTSAESKLVRALAPNVFGVGDPRQAIMGFRGADPEAFGPPTHRLTRTFRFGYCVAMVATDLIPHELSVDPDAPSIVTGHSKPEDIGSILDDRMPTAILVRTHEDGRAIERMLPDRVRRVRSNERDPLEMPADRIAEVERQGFVPVLTVHAAKGREWDRVIVVGPSTIRWGHASDDPEEMRVLYVAVTRARRELVLINQMPDDPIWRVVASAFDREPW